LEKRLSIVVPCYNEEKYIGPVLKKIDEVLLPNEVTKELIIVNDGSTDSTASIIEAFKCSGCKSMVKIIHRSSNGGKGACIIDGIQDCTGELIIIQDADFEYDPKEYNKLLQPVLEGYADVVYTSRLRGDAPRRVMFFYHTLGVSLLTFLSNLFTQLNLTDVHSGLKLFKAAILKNIDLKEKRFGFDTEVTAKISKMKGIRIYEVGIAYYGRRYSEGKKIKWTDGIKAIFWTLKYNVFRKWIK
jgi:glycosyltransferase involved in cell wall biosynthesis